ncbi:MAG: M28 family peptidase [Bacteroidota bacterium]
MDLLKIIIFFLINFIVKESITIAQEKCDTILLRQHLTTITKREKARHFENPEVLDSVAAYIYREFEKSADSVYYQTYRANGTTYRNVIAVFGSKNQKRIIVGAHYDVCGNQEGADDNGSGTVALLELSRMLKGKELQNRIDLVAYTLEEPPYFRTDYMGSAIHAKSIEPIKDQVLGMISIEMIGYFSDKKNSQEYPLGILKWFYGGKGNYITLVRKSSVDKFVKRFIRNYKKSKLIKAKKFAAPRSLPGIDFSDHLNYWNLGIDALMITDTSFYRNKNYHKETDTMETLDFAKMAKVINATYQVLVCY